MFWLLASGTRLYVKQRVAWLAKLTPARFTVLLRGLPQHGNDLLGSMFE
jgi:hypothetical protein